MRLLKAHKFVQQGCFFFRCSLATSMTNWVTDLLFYAYFGINQVRIVVFDNYHLKARQSTPTFEYGSQSVFTVNTLRPFRGRNESRKFEP